MLQTVAWNQWQLWIIFGLHALYYAAVETILCLALEAEAFGHTHRDQPKGRKVFPGCYRLYKSIDISIYIINSTDDIFTSYVHLSNSSIGVLDQPHMTRCYTLHGAKCQQGERHPSCARRHGSARLSKMPGAPWSTSCASMIRTL